MKGLTVPAVALLAIALSPLGCAADVPEQPAVPVGNPDDQIRFFWGLDWRMYDSLPPAGFNMAGGKWMRVVKGASADSVKITNLADGKVY